MIDPILEARIIEVCSTKSGWLDGEGEAVNIDPQRVIRIITALMENGFERPYIYPIYDGCVVLEWGDTNGNELIISGDMAK